MFKKEIFIYGICALISMPAFGQYHHISENQEIYENQHAHEIWMARFQKLAREKTREEQLYDNFSKSLNTYIKIKANLNEVTSYSAQGERPLLVGL